MATGLSGGVTGGSEVPSPLGVWPALAPPHGSWCATAIPIPGGGGEAARLGAGAAGDRSGALG